MYTKCFINNVIIIIIIFFLIKLHLLQKLLYFAQIGRKECISIDLTTYPLLSNEKAWNPGGHFHIMELRIRVNKNVEKGSDFCHRASSTFLEIRGQFSTTSTLRVSILNNEHRHLGSYFSAHQMLLQISRFSRN